MQTYNGHKDEFGVKVQKMGSKNEGLKPLDLPEPTVDFLAPKEQKKATPAPSDQDLKVARAKAILAGNSKRKYYKKRYTPTPKTSRSASYDAPHWSLLDNPSPDNHRGWGNMIAGLGRDLTVSQVRDSGVMPNQRRDWSDWRGTARKAK